MQPDPRVVVRLEPGGDLGHGVDHSGGVGGRRAHDQHGALVDRGEQLLRGHPPRRRVHLDADEAQSQQVGGLTESGVRGDGSDDRPTAAGLAAGDLAGGETGEDAALGPAGGDAAEDLPGRATEDRADAIDDPAVDLGDRGEHRGIETVDPVRQPGRAGGQLVELLQPGVVDVTEDPPTGRGWILCPQRGQPGQGVLPAVGDLEGQGLGGHARSVHRG